MVRIKERYLLVNILYPRESSEHQQTKIPDVVFQHQPTSNDVTPPAVLKGIRSELSSLFGDYGLGSVEGRLASKWFVCCPYRLYLILPVRYFSHATSTLIIKTSRDHYRLVWAALTCMRRLPIKGGKPCVFSVVHVSGTIRKVEEEAVRRAKQHILTAKATSANLQERGWRGFTAGSKQDDADVDMLMDAQDTDSEDAPDDQDDDLDLGDDD